MALFGIKSLLTKIVTPATIGLIRTTPRTFSTSLKLFGSRIPKEKKSSKCCKIVECEPKCCKMVECKPSKNKLQEKVHKKSYKKTYVECKRKPRKVLKGCPKISKEKPKPRRKRKAINRTSCREPKPSGASGKCKTAVTGDPNCKRIKVHGCPKANIPPKCEKFKQPVACKKVYPPHASFSECPKAKIKPLPKDECHCFAKEICTITINSC